MGTALCALAQGSQVRRSGPPNEQEKELFAESWSRGALLLSTTSAKPLCGPLKTHSSPPGGQVVPDTVESLDATFLRGEE